MKRFIPVFLCTISFFLSSYICFSKEEPAKTRSFASYIEAFEAGKKACTRDNMVLYRGKMIKSGFARNPIDLFKAQTFYREALQLAKTDKEKSSAFLAIGETQLYDQTQTDYKDIRESFMAVLNLTTLSKREKGRALLGIGETYLREENYLNARKYFQEAEKEGLINYAQLSLGYSYLQERDYSSARNILEKLNQNMKEVIAGTLVAPDQLTILEVRQIHYLASEYLVAIDQLPLIIRNRPRLFFNEKTFLEVKKRALTEEKEYFSKIKKEVEGIKHIKLDKVDYGYLLMKTAFVYKVTENPLLLENMRKMFRSTFDYYLSRQKDWIRSYSRVSAISAFDWVCDDLPIDERKALASDLLKYVYQIYIEERIENRLNHDNWYYVQDMFWYAGVALLDETLDNVSYARVLTILGEGYRHEQRMFRHMIKTSGDDGGWQTMLDYAFGHQPTVFWAFIHCWRSATGKDVESDWVHIVNPDFVLRNFLGVEGRAIRNFGYSRSWGRKTTGPDLLYDHLRNFIHLFGRSEPEYSAIAGLLAEKIREIGPSQGVYPVNPFLYTNLDKVPVPSIPKGMPFARHFENIGLVLMSSGFNLDDTYVLFAAGGGNVFSSHFDTTHFSIYKQGDLALDSGSGNIGQHTEKYSKQTVAHNAVLIHTPNDTNHGGQVKTTNFAKVLAFETSALFSYVATDATRTYHPDKCKQMVRQFIYFHPNHFLILDRVVSAKPEYKKEWLLHTIGEPIITGQEVKSEIKQGRIFCRTLYPYGAIIEKIGGEGKEFWASGKNWMPEDFYTTKIPETMGLWRVEVSPAIEKEEDVFLHLIQVSNKKDQEMCSSKILEEEDKLIVFFSGIDGINYEVILNKTKEIGGHIKIIKGGKTLWDKPLIKEVMPQSRLAIQNHR